LDIWSNSIPINSQNLLTEPISPHYIETYKLRIQILILKSNELLASLKYVINIILQIIYMGVTVNVDTCSLLDWYLRGWMRETMFRGMHSCLGLLKMDWLRQHLHFQTDEIC
jgi:hypothetical protein